MPDDTLVDSLAPTVMPSPSGDARAVAPPSNASFEGARYARKRVLGAGGMGEVRLCEDAWIGRDVAMKVAHRAEGGSSSSEVRFLREARVQGQLEHPSIVPVYDIGKLDGETFFTMKRVGGHTLDEIVVGLRERRADIVAKYNRRKLLAATSQVCLTIAYAHSRGVIHRDLKPANVMLGDFGEVYVLDWGVAKLAAAPDASPDTSVEAGERAVTQAGAIIGTPGYMAPEQIRGEAIGPRADVYALGAILFEVLALQPLHQGASMPALLASSLQPAPSPSARVDDVAPELDAIAARATALEPGDRFESARAMHDAIEAFLDGERDAERRRELARDHVARGRAALAKASEPDGDAEARRAEGMRELGRAVALDPSDEGALHAIRELILAPASDLPRAAIEELRATEQRDRATAAKRSARMYLVWLATVPLLLVMGVRSWPMVAAIAAFILSASAYTWWLGGAPERTIPSRLFLSMALNFVVVGATSLIFGPLVFVPGLATSSAASFVLVARDRSWLRIAPFALALLAVFGPLALEHLGVLPEAYTFGGGVITVHPVVANFSPTSTALSFMLVTFVQILMPAVLINRAVDNVVDAERRSFAQAWRLRQLLP